MRGSSGLRIASSNAAGREAAPRFCLFSCDRVPHAAPVKVRPFVP
jgi:hypothetical protein